MLALTGGPALAQRTSDLRAEAFRLYDAGQYREALPYLDAVVGRRHRDIEAHIKRGNAHLRLDQPEQALADFDSMVPFAPSYPGVFAGRGIAHTMLGQLDAARDDFTRAIVLYQRPTFPGILVGGSDINSSWNVSNPPPDYHDFKGRGQAIAHCGLGQVYHRMGQDERAIVEYNLAIRINPLDPNSHAGRGDAYAALDQVGPALADYDEAIRLAPNHAHAIASRGEALARLGETARALADFDRAIRIDPGSARARRLRGALLSRLGATRRRWPTSTRSSRPTRRTRGR